MSHMNSWRTCLQAWKISLKTYITMGPHLMHCHLIIANVANMATRSKLGKDHPIRHVMKIFIYNTTTVNYGATLFLTRVCYINKNEAKYCCLIWASAHSTGGLLSPPYDRPNLRGIHRWVWVLCWPRWLQVRNIPRLPEEKRFRQRHGEQDSYLDRCIAHLASLPWLLWCLCWPILLWRWWGMYIQRVQDRAKKCLLKSVTDVPSRLMGCASAALSSWVAEREEI